jgi:hypothetical protein
MSQKIQKIPVTIFDDNKENNVKIRWFIILFINCFLIACSPPEKGINEKLSSEISWNVLEIPEHEKEYRFFQSGVWDGEKFILLVSQNKSLVATKNGILWSKIDIKTDGYIDDIAVTNNRKFLKISNTWSVESENGSWRPLVQTNTTAPIWDGSSYVCFSFKEKFTSKDLMNWDRVETTQLPELPKSINFSDGKFIAHVDYHKNFISNDGVLWQPLYPESRTIYMTSWNGELYGSADNLPAVRMYSGSKWDMVFMPKLGPRPSDMGLTVINNMLFSFGAHISWSENGKDWGSYNMPIHEDVEKIIYGNDRYLAIGTGDLLLLGVTEKDKTVISKEIEEYKNLKNPFFL